MVLRHVYLCSLKSFKPSGTDRANTVRSMKAGFSGIQVVAAVMVLVALILAALAVYLFLKRSRRGWNGKGD